MRREVQLKQAFAALYPSLVPGRWYTAAAVAGLVKGTAIIQNGADTEMTSRVLEQDHFNFRGGSSRSGPWAGLRTRYWDRHADLSTF